MDKGATDNLDNAVGYKKPPRRTQFRPGQSGNPKGRPKKVKTVEEVFAKQLSKSLTLTIAGKRQKKSMFEAITMQQISKALSGDHRATTMIIKILQSSPNSQDNNVSELLSQFRKIHAQQE
jgi:hypothetical protein